MVPLFVPVKPIFMNTEGSACTTGGIFPRTMPSLIGKVTPSFLSLQRILRIAEFKNGFVNGASLVKMRPCAPAIPVNVSITIERTVASPHLRKEIALVERSTRFLNFRLGGDCASQNRGIRRDTETPPRSSFLSGGLLFPLFRRWRFRFGRSCLHRDLRRLSSIDDFRVTLGVQNASITEIVLMICDPVGY